MTKLYKILDRQGRAIHGGDFQYSLPTQRQDGSWQAGDWHRHEGGVKLCVSGFHLATKLGKWLQWDSVIWEAEAEGIEGVDERGGKLVTRSVRLVQPAEVPEYWQRANHFVKEEIPAVKWYQPDGEPLAEWKLFLDAARDTARNAAWNAARNAAWNAAWNTARDAARDTARNAAWNAARNAAGNAAEDAAWDAAWNAAWDAAIFCRVEAIGFDLPIAEYHREYARKRWQVWQKGYACLCDVNGVLYVYGIHTYLSTFQVAERLNCSEATARQYAAKGLLIGARKKNTARGQVWEIPADALTKLERPKRGKPQ